MSMVFYFLNSTCGLESCQKFNLKSLTLFAYFNNSIDNSLGPQEIALDLSKLSLIQSIKSKSNLNFSS